MDSTEAFDDERPFVNEECGDTMWDEVLAEDEQRTAKRLPVPPFTLETAQQKVQLAQDGNEKERLHQEDCE
jgi:hypothetical protein